MELRFSLVGMLPSLWLKDNVIQAIVIAVVSCITVVVGSVVGGSGGALVAALAGLVASTLISGFVLMVLGWIRAAQKLDR